MSRGLDYLLAARPEALGAYFAFLKQAGSHLDPKTRALISVISKVSAQTETGFRQYLLRALQAGVTPNEVLDALFMAFPMLGFSRLVWAAEQLTALDLPEFRPEALRDAPRWHDLGACSDFAPGAVRRLEVDGRGLFVRSRAEACDVYDSRCPHQDTDLSEAGLNGDELRCPRHGWSFDLASGACTSGGDRPLRRYPTRIDGGRILALW